MEHANREKELAVLTEAVRAELKKIFDANNTGEQRADTLVEKIQPTLMIYSELRLISEADVAETLSGLKDCGGILREDEFISRTADLIQPLLKLRISHAPEIEKVQRKIFVESGEFVSLNEILSYDVDGKTIHIHLAPAKTIDFSEKKKLITDGLKALAQIIKEDGSIKEITATSWIVAKAPKILERLGFTIVGEIDEDTKVNNFIDEDRAVSQAVMSRETLLTKYN